MGKFSIKAYDKMLEGLFQRFPSFQKAGASAYKPGLEHMLVFDGLLGHPHRNYPAVHVAGTNGKGSVSNMLACALAENGLKTGLYTSPHILDFRERMRIIENGKCTMIDREEVWRFVMEWRGEFERLDLSFFEITTAMAFSWFADKKVDVAVIETGLGGRLDSTNIITPVLSVITNIGMDHCDLLGSTLPEIAFEKAGIIKSGVPALVGESNPETDAVFERASLLTFADRIEPSLWGRAEEMLADMDLQGPCQRKNLRTVLAAVDILGEKFSMEDDNIIYGIENTAQIADFHGRWEKLCDNPWVIADIGHNSHGLKENFSRLEEMLACGDYSSLTIVYGAMADKDVAEIMKLLPKGADYVFVTAPGRRAMPAEDILGEYLAAGGDPSRASCHESVEAALEAVWERLSIERHTNCDSLPLVYIGGSTYIVSEAYALLQDARHRGNLFN